MLPKLVPACQTPAGDGSVFVTNSEKVREARAMVEEDLLLRHPIDCPICDKAGECYLQDYHFKHGREQRRADIKPFTSRRRSLGDTVTLFVDRCVMCSRCVRFCREIAGTGELLVSNRGTHEEIDVFPGYPLANKLAGNVVDLCPVGALGDKDFLYQQRVWFMKNHKNVCASCSTGCSIHVDENQDHIYRLRPRTNPHVNQWWMCDEGRYGWKYVHDPARIADPSERRDEQHVPQDWTTLLPQLGQRLQTTGRLAAVLSPFQTVEEAYLLAELVRQFDEAALIAVGPIPVVGQDERFPTGFTIRAEKCPNRKGVEMLASQLSGELVDWQQFLERLDGPDAPRGVWVAGGYPAAWAGAELARQFADLDLLVVQEVFPSPLGAAADFRLPTTTFAERDGSYVNALHRLQSFTWAIRPPWGVEQDGQLYWRLLSRPGMYSSRAVREEVAGRLIHFSAAAGPIPDVGVDLRVNQLATEPAAVPALNKT
jgi:NADH-quinone oxidoreductase subunit G